MRQSSWPSAFAEWLADQLADRGWDLDARGWRADLARKAGIPRAAITRIFSDGTTPAPATIHALAAATGIPATAMLTQAGIIHDPHHPTTPPPVTTSQALEALGVDPDDRPAVLHLIQALAAARDAPPS